MELFCSPAIMQDAIALPAVLFLRCCLFINTELSATVVLFSFLLPD